MAKGFHRGIWSEWNSTSNCRTYKGLQIFVRGADGVCKHPLTPYDDFLCRDTNQCADTGHLFDLSRVLILAYTSAMFHDRVSLFFNGSSTSYLHVVSLRVLLNHGSTVVRGGNLTVRRFSVLGVANLLAWGFCTA